MADDIKETMKKAGNRVAEKATEAKNWVEEKAEEASDWVKQKKNQAQNRRRGGRAEGQEQGRREQGRQLRVTSESFAVAVRAGRNPGSFHFRIESRRTQRRSSPSMTPRLLVAALLVAVIHPVRAAEPVVRTGDDFVEIETDSLVARIQTKGYVSGTAAAGLLDKKTKAHDLGFGLHVMDFLLAPGWRDDGYSRDPKLHGNLPKHYVEGPQICTKAKELKPEITRGKGFVAVTLRYTLTEPGKGYAAGSTWEQTMVFQPGCATTYRPRRSPR